MAFIEAMRYIGNNPAAELCDALRQKDSGCNTIGIKVAVDGNELIPEQGAKNSGHCLIHLLKQEGVVCQPLISGEKGVELGWVCDAAIVEQLNE
jgi:hypothetical protein